MVSVRPKNLPFRNKPLISLKILFHGCGDAAVVHNTFYKQTFKNYFADGFDVISQNYICRVNAEEEVLFFSIDKGKLRLVTSAGGKAAHALGRSDGKAGVL